MMYKHYTKNKHRAIYTPIKTGGVLRCPGRISSSCSTYGTHRVNLVANLVISNERGPDCDYDKWNRQMGHTRGHLWHRYYITWTSQIYVLSYKLLELNLCIHVIAPALRGSLPQMSPQKTTPAYKPFSPAYPWKAKNQNSMSKHRKLLEIP